MSVAETSKQALEGHRVSGALGQQSQRVLRMIAKGEGMTRGEIAAKLGEAHSSVCARVNELIKCGQAIDYGTRKCAVSGKTAKVVRIKRRKLSEVSEQTEQHRIECEARHYAKLYRAGKKTRKEVEAVAGQRPLIFRQALNKALGLAKTQDRSV